MSSFGPGYQLGLALEKQPQDTVGISEIVRTMIEQGAYELCQSEGLYKDVHAEQGLVNLAANALIDAIRSTAKSGGAMKNVSAAGEVEEVGAVGKSTQKRLCELIQSWQDGWNGDQCCTQIAHEFCKGRKTGEVEEMEKGEVGKVGRQDFTVDWQHNGKGGAFKATNCTDPAAAVERAIPELRKFARASVGEVIGAAESMDEYICSKCGAAVKNGDDHCSNCQEKLDWREIQADHQDGNRVGEIAHASTPFDEPFSCGDCGSPVYTGDLHCSNCGKPLNWEAREK